MKIAIIYHKDLDGYCSAAIVKRKFPDAILIPMEHGDAFDWHLVDGMDTIYLLDFVMHTEDEILLFEDMEKLSRCCNTLVWIDHHISANRNYREYRLHGDNSLTNLEYTYQLISACELTWGVIHGTEVPRFVELIGMADTWRCHGTTMWKNEIEPFVLGLQLINADPAHTMIGWDILFDGGAFDIDDVIADGKVIARYNETTNAKRAIRDAHEITFDNKRCIAINSNSHSSDILDAVAKPGVHVLRIIYSLNKDQKWYVSVYGEDKMVDCSEICKRNGGGGHRGAGGLLCEKLPWSQPC